MKNNKCNRVRQHHTGCRQRQELTKQQNKGCSPTLLKKASEQRVEANAITTAPTPTFEYSNDVPANSTPVITQDKDDMEDETPVENYSNKLQSQSTQTMTDEWLYSMMELPGITTNVTNTVTPKMAMSQKYPMRFYATTKMQSLTTRQEKSWSPDTY